jgi:hypothetical protein
LNQNHILNGLVQFAGCDCRAQTNIVPTVLEVAMKEIELTQGQVAIVDDWWFDYLSQWKWYADWCKNTQSFRACRMEKRKCIRMHRVVAKTPDGMICDHIHHNTLDNRESELRNVSPSQSVINTKTRSDNKLGIRGVCKCKYGYRAQMCFAGEKVLNGTFKTINEAIGARLDAEKKYFGEYSYSS